MNEEIKRILSSLPCPVSHLRYRGTETTYVVWGITGEYISQCVDDRDRYGRIELDVDVYSKGNYTNIVNQIKQLFFSADGWCFSETSSEMFEEDTEMYHICISFKKGITIDG